MLAPAPATGCASASALRLSGIEADLIRFMAETQQEHFARLGLDFQGLRGRPLQLIDCQNLFCEVDKYARVAHPDVAGLSGRSRIKQKFSAVSQPITAWFPPKWGINNPTVEEATTVRERSRVLAVGPDLTRQPYQLALDGRVAAATGSELPQAAAQASPKCSARTLAEASDLIRPAATVI